jgi:ferritin
MFHQKIQDAFNHQINAELFSSYLYLSMSAYFESQGFKGMATWMRIQAQEEELHAMKFFDFINERGGRVVMTAIEAPKTEWSSPLEVFEDAYAHERKVTGLINGLVDLALAEKDHAAHVFLQWFVTEQVEEEASATEVIDGLKLAGDKGTALLMLDRELGQRTPPAAPPA